MSRSGGDLPTLVSDEVRGTRGLRPKRLRQDELKVSMGRLRNTKPVETHLRVETSPLPTSLNSRTRIVAERKAWSGDASDDWIRRLVGRGARGSAQLDRDVRDNLQQQQGKDATGNLAMCESSSEWGCPCTDA